MPPRVWVIIGTVLIIFSVIGLVFAFVNLISLPSTQDQLLEIIPGAEAAVAQAAAQSRDKSYIGIFVCLVALVFGVVFTRRGGRIKQATGLGFARFSSTSQ